MALMSLLSRSHVKASMVLTRADLCIHYYIRSLLNIIYIIFKNEYVNIIVFINSIHIYEM